MIVFGGAETIAQTWALTLGPPQHWDLLPTSGGPSGRKDAAMVYDPVRHRMLLFGGYDSNYRNDVWALSLDAPLEWTQIVPNGTPPSGRMYTVAVYDPLADRMLVMGGHPTSLNDVWALELTGPAAPRWVQIVPTGTLPPPRYGHVGAFDAPRNRLVIWGAADASVWSLSFTTMSWTEHVIPGSPPVRQLMTGSHDLAGERLLVFGGYPANSELWELKLNSLTWSFLTPAGSPPPARWLHCAALDPVGSRMVVFGGLTLPSTPTASTFGLAWTPPSTAPVIAGFEPIGGLAGDHVTITGVNLASPLSVRFNGVEADILSSTQFTIVAVVPSGATTGPIEVTTSSGTAVSSGSFTITIRPEIASFHPDSGYVDTEVTIHGRYFNTALSVAFGGVAAQYVIQSDSVIVATVPAAATTSPVRVISAVGTVSSATNFRMLSPFGPPRLVSVRDVKSDQGGKVTLKWMRSDHDGLYLNNVRSYRIWRRAPADANVTSSPGARPAFAQIDFWEEIGTVAAARLLGYSFTAPTLRDSLTGDNPYTAFFVQAVTDNPATFYSSAVDSGYSVDNLSPPAPLPFFAVYEPTGTALHWTPSRAPDFAFFRLYRGASVDFVPGPGNLVSAQSDTGYFDPAGGSLYFYKLTAVDLHGNVGRYSLVTPMGPTAVLATALDAAFHDGRVRIRWYVSAELSGECTIERNRGDGFWLRQGTAAADGNGYLRWEDDEVEYGVRYVYRLRVPTDDGEVVAGEVAVEVPDAEADEAIRVPNPVVAGDITVSMRAAAGQPVRIELMDVTGRRMALVEATGQGQRMTLRLARAEALSPGLYFVRFQQPALPSRRVAIVR
jgi:hypothetical protein